MFNDDNYNDIGLFRFSLISPVINNIHGFNSKQEYFTAISQKKHLFNGKEYQFSASCIKSWYLNYLKNGFCSLEKHSRKDFKSSRKLNNDCIERIITLRKQFPNMTGTSIYKKLIDEKYINSVNVSLDTVLRYLRINNLKSSQIIKIDRRMFEMEHINDCWQSDTSDGPYLTINKQKYRTKLIMFIDDKSRMIMGFDFFLNDTAINMQKVLKIAVKTYGIPKRLFVDNGGPYANKQLSLICASLGIQLIHAKPYSPESKAKIERSFRTIKDGWMRCTDWNEFKSLDDIKNSLKNFLYNNYINKVHSSTGITPNARWHNEFKNIKFLEEKKIDESFLHRNVRKVRKDRTIKIDNTYYEVPFKYVGKEIEIRYDPNNTEEIFIFENDKKCEECKVVDKIANSKVKRKNSIDYGKVINDERNVIEMEKN
ncbi:MAG: DDE-type integrase/transposase/recombinase [Roseburia sp.]|nr:DDE-type integrase/transposase/recombinase [Roseburia sp.]